VGADHAAVEVGLAFLGVGIAADTPWPVLAGGLPLVLTTLGFTFLGESLRDVFDARLVHER
jgi:peptide/nickel transport system permease protein